jgi:hypothetical protein
MSATDSTQLSIAYSGKLTVHLAKEKPKVSGAFSEINADHSADRRHRLGPGSDLDMPKTSATSHRYLPYLQQVTALIN